MALLLPLCIIQFRVNVKNNIVRRPVIWAHGYGLRCNYPIENGKRVRPVRRDTYATLGDLMDKYVFHAQNFVKVFILKPSEFNLASRVKFIFVS